MSKKITAFDVNTSTVSQIIDDWIFNEKHRCLLKRKLIDGLTIEQVADEFEYSPRQVQRILNAGMSVILRKIKFYVDK